MKHPALETEQYQKQMGFGRRRYQIGYLGMAGIEFYSIHCHSYDYSLYRFCKAHPDVEPVSVTWTELE